MIRHITCSVVMLFALAAHAQQLDWKKYHKQFAQVEKGLYASRLEASNVEYRTFLEHLKEQDNPWLLRKAMVDTAQWASVLDYHRPYEHYYFQHDAYNDYPVVNISRKGAQLFCEWLTREYNADPKRKYAEVVFRLPTEAEWKKAARGGQEKALLPWGGPYLRSTDGSYLANFRSIPESTIRMDHGDSCMQYVAHRATGKKDEATGKPRGLAKSLDNAIVLAPVKSNEPSAKGFYNLAGNAAEMVASETRHTIGGAWNTTGYFLRIDADDPFAEVQGGHPAIGFRVFMEIVEE